MSRTSAAPSGRERILAGLVLLSGRAHRFFSRASWPLLPAVLACALCSCSAASGARVGTLRQPPGVIPAFSLAGREASDCAEARNLQRWVYGFESFGSQALEPDDARAERAAQIGGIGHPIVHYFYCRPFVAELADLLDRARSEEDMDAERARALFATVLAGKPARSALWTLAATMRIHPDEPFIYGRHLWLSGGESLSVSFDPTQSDARMMLNYRFGF